MGSLDFDNKLNTYGTIAPAQERAEPCRPCAGPVQVLCRACTRTVQALCGSCTGPVRVPVRNPYITHIMAAQVWHRHRTRSVRGLHKNRTGPVQVLCRACAGPVQDLCKTVGHICPSRPLSVNIVFMHVAILHVIDDVSVKYFV